jgi:hypothetical protein
MRWRPKLEIQILLKLVWPFDVWFSVISSGLLSNSLFNFQGQLYTRKCVQYLCTNNLVLSWTNAHKKNVKY